MLPHQNNKNKRKLFNFLQMVQSFMFKKKVGDRWLYINKLAKIFFSYQKFIFS